MSFFIELKARNELLYYFGMACLLAAVLCAVLIRFSNVQVLGVNAFYKPLKFFLSTTIFVWSMGWYAHYLDKPAWVLTYSIGLIVLFTVEDIYIFMQAVRGQMSHFNVHTDFLRLMWGIMGFCAVAISVSTFVVSIPFFTGSVADLPSHYLWAIRFGILIFFVFSLEGLVMGARMAHSVAGADGSPGLPLVNWSKTYGDLRIAHFLGMHALQIIPLASYYVLKSTRLTVVFAVIYFAITAATLAQALAGKPLTKLF